MLVDVKSSMSISSTIIDVAHQMMERKGYYTDLANYATTVDTVSDTLNARAPLFDIYNGGKLTIIGGDNTQSYLRNNYNLGSNGGAVNINLGGLLKMNEHTYVDANFVKDTIGEEHHGGAIYMAANADLLLSDDVMINTNKHVSDDMAQTKAENVYLADSSAIISVGTILASDTYGPLNDGAKIGVTKTDWRDHEIMPIVFTEDVAHYTNLLGNTIVFDEEPRYVLYEYPRRHSNNDPDCFNKLYWVKTWTDVVTSIPDGFPISPAPNDVIEISTPQQLAWAISYVNGLNSSSAHPNQKFAITRDIDMDQYIWVPIGTSMVKYKGIFEGNGFLVSGIHSPLPVADKGMFGVTDENAIIRNLQAIVDFYKGNASNLGGIVGHLAGGKLYNVESAGYLETGQSNGYIGGLVGLADSTSIIHSCFATDTLAGLQNGMYVGGLVGYLGGENASNSGLLLNSYSFFSVDTLINQTENIGGLVGYNAPGGLVENCYVHNVVVNKVVSDFGWLASKNDGTIKYSYIPAGHSNYVGSAGTSYYHGGFGSYSPVKDRKAIGYMYDDNKVTKHMGDGTSSYHAENDYVVDTVCYENMPFIVKWDGLLSTLNQWVKAKSKQPAFDKETFTSWFRPTTAVINGDLPILAFPMDSTVATYDHDSLFLKYSRSIDSLLVQYQNDTSSLFHYGTATNVKNFPSSKEKVFINEDAVLLQDETAGDFINTTVGITFDNSGKHSYDYYSDSLEYNWHLMSTPLANAKMGTTYGKVYPKVDSLIVNGTYVPHAGDNIIYQTDSVDIVSMVDGYFPNGLPMASGYALGYNNPDSVKWDFYSYFEPEFHWINLKRNKNNHFHHEAYENNITEYAGRPYQVDETNLLKHFQINYTETDQSDTPSGDANCYLTRGKGYMMAISQESYLSSTGTLNSGNVSVKITAKAPADAVGYATHDKGSNLLGNPYQAYLDLDMVSNTNDNYGYECFWIYDADSVSTGVHGLYRPYTKEASLNHILPSRYIHPHQGFFVVYEPTGTEDESTFTFKPYMATTDTTSQSYFRAMRQSSRPTYPLVNLFMKDSHGNADLAIVEFNRPEVGGVKKIDNLRHADFTMYSKFEGENYGLLFTPEGTERVPVFFKTPYNDTYTLSWEKCNGTFEVMRLIDNITGTDYDMLTHDHYTFEGRASDFAARFYIVFSLPDPDDPGDPDEPNEDDDDNFAFFNGIGWVVNGTGQLELVDMLGQVLYANHIDGNPTMVHFDDFAAGTYVLRLVNSNKILKSQKIVIY